MTDTGAKCARGRGNTLPPPNACKHWILTIKAEGRPWEALKDRLVSIGQRFVGQLEKGEGGYLHYQIYLCLKSKLRLAQLKKHLWEDIHAEICKDIKGAEEYCRKSVTRQDGPWEYPEPVGKYDHIKIITELYPWQKDLTEIVLKEPDDRSIIWWWEPTGKTGKTSWAKYMCVKHKAAYVKGKRKDMLYAATLQESPIYIIDLSRCDEHDVPYEGMEDLKNGIFFSGKYESCQVIRNCPHIVVLANYPPDRSRLSLDRWIIHRII